MTRDEVGQLAEDWVAAWNAHDLEAIISHYDERVELISPVAEHKFAQLAWMMITVAVGAGAGGQPARCECDTTIARSFATDLLQMAGKVTKHSM